MNFYTNVLQWGNYILLREVKNGARTNTRIRYTPTLFASVKEPTKHKTLQGQYVTPIKLQSMKEAKEWNRISRKQ